MYPDGARRYTPDYYPDKPRIISIEAHDKRELNFIKMLVAKHKTAGIKTVLGHTTHFPDGSIVYEVFILHSKADKKAALKHALKLQGIPREKAVAVVDGPNDISVMNAVGIGVAMGNATPKVLNQSVFIAPTQADDGATFVLQQLIQG